MYTLMHEHMSIDLSEIKQDEDCHVHCFEETKKELLELYSYGVRQILDVTNIGMGRDIAFLQKLEQETGIRLYPSTGFYKDPFLPMEVKKKSVQQLAKKMISEIEEGIENTTQRAVCIGEIGTSKDYMTYLEKKVFDAAILAQKKTGVMISTHTTLGTYALEQVAYFLQNGVHEGRILISHMDLQDDFEIVKAILDMGVTIGFDTIGKENYCLDKQRISRLLEIEAMDKISQVVVSMDITRKSNLKSFGGIGYGYLFTNFLPQLREKGMKEESIQQMLIDNPKRLLRQEVVK